MNTETILKPSRSGAGNGRIADFFNSNGFIWLVALFTLAFWSYGREFYGIIFLAALITVILFTCEDATPAIAVFIFVFFVFSDTGIELAGREKWILCLIAPVVGFIYNIIRFKNRYYLFKGFSLAHLFTLVPWFLQGAVRIGRETESMLVLGVLAVAYVAVYFGISACARRKNGMTKYILNVLLALGVLISVQVIIFYLRRGDYKFEYDYVLLGWGSRNPVAAILALCLPAAFYFATQKGKFNFLFLVLGYVEFALILVLRSRGVTIVACLEICVLMFYSISKAENKKAVLLINVLFVVFSIGCLAFAFDKVMSLFRRFLTSGLDGLGREELYREGLRVFKEYPIFGAGFDYKTEIYYQCVPHSKGPVYYHSTLLQIMACFGVVGLVFYGYLYYWRYRVAVMDFNKMKFALLIGMVALEFYSFIDTVYFQPMAYFLMIMISFCMERETKGTSAVPQALKIEAENYFLINSKSELELLG